MCQSSRLLKVGEKTETKQGNHIPKNKLFIYWSFKAHAMHFPHCKRHKTPNYI